MTENRTPAQHADTKKKSPADEAAARAITWLEEEFPGWTVEIDETSTWEGDLRPLWIARKEGHHAQAELTAAKLHTRLDEYHARESAKTAHSN